ncbi:hypothetical protein FJ366_00195 [Candidatus Dependentiae bacterium]|nr:hypothetical protein [Candidatus Dependentiae bacterium]
MNRLFLSFFLSASLLALPQASRDLVLVDNSLVTVSSDHMMLAIADRVEQISARVQKRNLIAAGAGILAIIIAWKLYRSQTSSVPVAADNGATATHPQLTIFGKIKDQFSTIFAFTIASVFATFLTTDVFPGVRDFVYSIWKGQDNVRLFKILMNASLVSLESTLLRKNFCFSLLDQQIKSKYNSHLIAIQRYVVELSAMIIKKSSDAGIVVEGEVLQLLSQLERDIALLTADCLAGKYAESVEGNEISAKKMFSRTRETVYRLEDIFYSFSRAADPMDQEA